MNAKTIQKKITQEEKNIREALAARKYAKRKLRGLKKLLRQID
mgnify:CR=1 FL=1